MTELTNPAARDCFQIGERALRYRRLLPVLIEVAVNAERVETPRRREGRAWDQSVIALIDLPDYDDFDHDHGCEKPVVDGDVAAALQAASGEIIDRMTGRSALLEHDVALACGGRIAMILRNSPTGPVLTHLDGHLPQAGGERDDIPQTTDDGGDEVDVRRIPWVSTAETRETAERAFKWRWHGNSLWMEEAVALIDAPDSDHVRDLPTHRDPTGNWKASLEVATAVACEAMLPVTIDRSPLDPDHPEPLECDVALAVAGRIHALVQWSEAGPIVYRFRDLWAPMF